MEHVSNEEKANEICARHIFDSNHFDCCMEVAEWKDEQLPEWLTAFAVHLQKRGAFRDDLCMDFEHEAQSFIEFQKFNATQKGL